GQPLGIERQGHAQEVPSPGALTSRRGGKRDGMALSRGWPPDGEVLEAGGPVICLPGSGQEGSGGVLECGTGSMGESMTREKALENQAMRSGSGNRCHCSAPAWRASSCATAFWSLCHVAKACLTRSGHPWGSISLSSS